MNASQSEYHGELTIDEDETKKSLVHCRQLHTEVIPRQKIKVERLASDSVPYGNAYGGGQKVNVMFRKYSSDCTNVPQGSYKVPRWSDIL